MKFETIRFFIKSAYFCIDGFVSFCVSRKNKKDLVLIRLDAIGDFIIWLDAAKEYRCVYPNKKITLIANSTWAGMASNLPYWDDVWSVNLYDLTWKPFYRWEFLRKVRQANFETAIQPTYSRFLLLGDSVMRATRSTHRIGSIGDASINKVNDKVNGYSWYTRLIPASPKPMMELQRNAEFFSLLAGTNFKAALPQLPVMVALPKRLQQQRRYVILFPGASWQGRRWPTKSFVEVAMQLHCIYGWQIVLCGSSSDRELCQTIADSALMACHNLAGDTTLIELAELIRGAEILISNETSAVHIAAAVGTPSVCILGGGHFGRFMPYSDDLTGIKPQVAVTSMPCFNCDWKCSLPHDPSGPVPCISNVSVSLVLTKVQLALVASDGRVSTLSRDCRQ